MFRLRHLSLDTLREHVIIGVLNLCRGSPPEPNEIGLSDEAFHDFGLQENAEVNASLAVAPASVDLVRANSRVDSSNTQISSRFSLT